METTTNANVLAFLKTIEPVNFAKAEEVAEKFGVKVKSVIAIATRNGIKYEKKARLNKAGLPSVAKDDLVEKIADLLDVSVDSLAGLEKANKSALETLLANVDEIVNENADLAAKLQEAEAFAEAETEVSES